ncbi:Gfo/Idh/MocA family protein [Paenibacillus sp. strain BS8-2]
METLRIAIIGCGAIAEKHVSAIEEIGGEASIVALCDISSERLHAFASKAGVNRFPDATLYDDVGRLLERQDIDLVVVATSSGSHGSLTLQALQAGKHVLVEKPQALSLSEAKAAIDEARSRGLILSVSFQVRYMQKLAEMKRAVEAGRFGELAHGTVTMRWNRNMAYYESGPWREDWSKGGGLFMNQCIHYVDLLMWLMGPIRSVYALGRTNGQPIGVENVGAALLHFESGAIGVIEASANVYPKSAGTSVSLFGSTGSATVEGKSLERMSLWQFEDNGTESSLALHGTVWQHTHSPLYVDLIGAIRGGYETLVSASSTIGALEAVLAIYQSMASGLVVKLPLQDDFVMGSTGGKEEES